MLVPIKPYNSTLLDLSKFNLNQIRNENRIKNQHWLSRLCIDEGILVNSDNFSAEALLSMTSAKNRQSTYDYDITKTESIQNSS